MKIESITVEGHLCLRKRVTISFESGLNALIGTNGSGKSTILDLIAGLAGTDEATALLVGAEVGLVELMIGDGEDSYVFRHSGVLTDQIIGAFKSTLPDRVNFPLTQYKERFFPSECVKSATPWLAMEAFREAHSYHYDPTTGIVRTMWGDGYEHLNAIFSLTKTGMYLSDQIVLLDGPEAHLHIVIQHRLLQQLECNKQVIIATHSPEMIQREANVIDMGALL